MFKNRYLYFFIFITGAAIMAVEIAASRLLAPFFGNSMFIWAIIITIIMIGLALGYWWGGKFADRYPYEKGLFLTALFAGIFISIIPLVTRFLFRLVEQGIFATPLNTVVMTFISSCILFLPAVVLLGFMSPYVTRIMLDKVTHTGHVAGNIYAISTCGSIFGILVTAFIFIPFLGTRETILLFSTLVILVSVVGLRKWQFLLVLVLPVLIYIFGGSGIKNNSLVLFEDDTLYQFVQVVEDGSKKYLLFNEGGGFQSMFDFAKNLSGEYYDYFIFVPDLIGGKKQNIAILGFAGGVIAKELNLYKNKDYQLGIDGVEIDSEVAKLAKEYFAVDGDNITIHIADGRSYLTQTQVNYNIIIIDVYTREMYIPYHLCTKEFFSIAKSRLDKDGIIVMNVNAISENSSILTSITKTIGQIFNHVYLSNVPETSNYLVFASEAEIDFGQIKLPEDSPQELNVARDNLINYTKKINTDGLDQMILTDNRAPLEYLTDHLIFESLQRN